jgi:hypothetical protein
LRARALQAVDQIKQQLDALDGRDQNGDPIGITANQRYAKDQLGKQVR